jgi:hypothetical protein
MQRPVTNDVSDIVGAAPKPLRPFVSSAVATAAAGGRPPSPPRCVDPLNPDYRLSWVEPPSERMLKRAQGKSRPSSAAVVRSPSPPGSYVTDKLQVGDITRSRPVSAGVRERATGNRSYDYSDVARSTSAQNAHKTLNFTQRHISFALQTADIPGARPRPLSPEKRDPLSPRYKCDTSSLTGTLTRNRSLAAAAEYGGFEKRGALRRGVAAADAQAERIGAARVPSSLSTAVERPLEHPKSLWCARQRFLKHGLNRHADPAVGADDAADGSAPVAAPPHPHEAGVTRSSYTTFNREVRGGRGTNPADPVYDYGARAKPVAPHLRKTHADPDRDAVGRAAAAVLHATRAPPVALVTRSQSTSALSRKAADDRRREVDLVRQLPNW